MISNKTNASQSKADSSLAPQSGTKRGRKPKKTEEERYDVEEILDHKIEDGVKYFFIRWKGYGPDVDSWEQQKNLNCPALIVQYYEQNPEARVAARSYKADKRKKKNKPLPPMRPLKIDEQVDYDSEWDSNDDYEVEKIMDVLYNRDGTRDFLIRWKGYSSNSDSWEPEKNLDCAELIAKFVGKLERVKNVTQKELRPVRQQTQRFTLMTQADARRLSKRHLGHQRMDYIGLGCCALAFVLYYNTLDAGFVYDDRRAILGNPDVVHSTPWKYIVQNDFWGTPLTDSGSHGSYRPLCVLSYKLNHLFDGFKPVGYHLVNVLLHCLATGLVVKVARHVLQSIWGTIVTGALFASHPIHTEAVAGVVGRADLASCNFYLLAFLTYCKHVAWREQNDRRCWAALIGTIVLSIAAVLCKETAATSLLLCVLYDIIRTTNGYRDKHRMRSLSVLGVATVVILQLRLSLPGTRTEFSTADNPVAKSASHLTRFLTFLYLPAFNFQLLLYPTTLSFDWGMDAIPRLNSLCDFRNLTSLIFYSALVFAVAINVHHLRRRLQLVQAMAHVHYRKPRTIKKRKAFQLPATNCNNNNGSSCSFANANVTNQLHSSSLSTSCNNNSSYLAKTADRLCEVCKLDSNVRHSSSCRAINNNNVPLVRCECPEFRHSPSPPRKRRHQHNQHQHHSFVGSSMAIYSASSTSGALNGILPHVSSIGSSKSCKNSPTKNSPGTKTIANHANNCENPDISTPSSDAAATALNDSTTNHLHISHPSTTASAVIMLSIALLTLPFLPAANLFFYVGFVVAERILYLPSVGYCLLIGLGVSKLMDTNWGSLRSQQKRMAVMLSIGLTVTAYSMKTINRHVDWRDEESLYRSAINVNPPKALGNLGSVLSSQGRYEEAKESLQLALKYRPNMADVHYNLGILFQNNQQYKEAVDCFEKAVHYRPSLALAYLNMGTSLIALERCNEACKVLREGSKLDGHGLRDRTAHDNARMSMLVQLGSLYAEQGKLQRALSVYREALHSLPKNYPPQIIYHRLGDTLARVNQWSEAERFHQAALEVQPDHVATHVSYGTMLARNSSRTSEAELWFKRALKLAPVDSSVRHHYAEFLSSMSRNEEACEQRIKAAELSPNDYSLAVAAATAVRLLDRKNEAEKWYRTAVRLRPDDARAHTNLGAILHLLGRPIQAAISYKEALQLQPNDPTTIANLAKLGISEMALNIAPTSRN